MQGSLVTHADERRERETMRTLEFRTAAGCSTPNTTNMFNDEIGKDLGGGLLVEEVWQAKEVDSLRNLHPDQKVWGYKVSGYNDQKEEIGQDPITSVRTLRNTLRTRAARYAQSGKSVKSHICHSAAEKLSNAEGQLVQLHEQRSTALVHGDIAKAKAIKGQMEEIKEQAVHQAYVDLVMDDDEMRAFGIDSQWTPEPTKPPTPQKRAETPKRRPSSVRRDPTPPTPAPAPRPQRPPTPVKDVKRNERLGSGNASVAPPPQPQAIYGGGGDGGMYGGAGAMCQHCGMSDPSFSSIQAVEQHYITSCPVMTRCGYCSKIVLVSQLNDHQLNRCSFLGGKMTACYRCGQPINKTDQEKGMGHASCKGTPPPYGSKWCPFCGQQVQDSQLAWREHLTGPCTANPRQYGPESEPISIPDYSDELKSPEPVSSTPPVGTASASGLPPGTRLIDADKLVTALQEVQMRKKKKRQEAIAAVKAGEDPPADSGITVTETVETKPVESDKKKKK